MGPPPFLGRQKMPRFEEMGKECCRFLKLTKGCWLAGQEISWASSFQEHEIIFYAHELSILPTLCCIVYGGCLTSLHVSDDFFWRVPR